jgi:hypothetical protein
MSYQQVEHASWCHIFDQIINILLLKMELDQYMGPQHEMLHICTLGKA